MNHSYEVFFETLKAQGRSFLRFIQPPAAALSAPTQLRDALSILREIMSVYSTSLLDHEASVASPEKRQVEFKDVLDAALDPALQMCGAMAEMRPTTWDQAVFWVNCDEAVLGCLEPFDFTKERMEQVQEDEAKHVESLTAEHVRLSRTYRIASVADTLSLNSTSIFRKTTDFNQFSPL